MEVKRYTLTSNVVPSSFCIEKNKKNNVKNIGATLAFAVLIGSKLLYSSENMNGVELSNMSQVSYIKNISKDVVGGDNKGGMNCYDLLQIENRNKLSKMKEFQEDWNGYGAPAFTKETIDLFYKIIEEVYKQPKIAPTGKASLLMQYELDDKSLLAFEVSLGKTEMVYVPKGDYSKADVKVFADNFCDNINSCVEKFYGIG